MNRCRTLAAAGALTLALAACGSGHPSGQPSAAPLRSATDTRAEMPARTVTFTTREFTFAGPARIAAGPAKLVVVNRGHIGHQLALFKLNLGTTSAQALAGLSKAGNLEGGRPFGTWIAGPNSVSPGASHAMAVDLAAGHYLIACLLPLPDGSLHATKGMLANLEVTPGAPTPTPTPAPTLPHAVLHEYAIALPEHFGRGSFIVENAGSQVHELAIVKLHAGANLADVEAGTKYDDMGGVTFLDPGTTARVDLDLAPGRYAAVCFIPSPEGKPHVKLGMITGFTVA